MPIIGNDYQQPSSVPTGLSIPGAGSISYPPQRELTLGQMAGAGMEGVGAALQIPRLMAWNAGPALVGRAGQGPQTGHDLLSRLGANPDNRWTHGFGAGLEMLADPLMLGGMGGGATASRGIAGDAAGTLLGQLERHAGSGLNEAMRAASQRAVHSIPAQPGSVAAQRMRAMGVDAPALAGPAAGPAGGVGVPAPGMSPPWLRGTLPPGTNPGSTIMDPNTLVRVPQGGFPNFPQALVTNPAASQSAASRLDRYARPSPTSMTNEGNATMGRQLQQEFNVQPLNTPVGPAAPPPQMSTPRPQSSSPYYIGESGAIMERRPPVLPPPATDPLAGTQWLAEQPRVPTLPSGAGLDAPGSPPRSFGARTMTTPEFVGPPYPPAPATSGTPAMFPTGINQPPELGGLNLRAAWEAVRSGRGSTIPFSRGDTLPLMDY